MREFCFFDDFYFILPRMDPSNYLVFLLTYKNLILINFLQFLYFLLSKNQYKIYQVELRLIFFSFPFIFIFLIGLFPPTFFNYPWRDKTSLSCLALSYFNNLSYFWLINCSPKNLSFAKSSIANLYFLLIPPIYWSCRVLKFFNAWPIVFYRPSIQRFFSF